MLTGIGTILVGASFTADEVRPWAGILSAGSVVAAGGFAAAVVSGPMLRRRCLHSEEFMIRNDHRSRIAGIVSLSLSPMLLAIGIAMVTREPIEKGEDSHVYNGAIGGFAFMLPGFIALGVGSRLIARSRDRHGERTPRTQAWVGPGTLRIRTVW